METNGYTNDAHDDFDLAQFDDDFAETPVEEKGFEEPPDGKYQVLVDKEQQLTFVGADDAPLNPLGAIAFQARYFTRDNKTGNAESCGDVVPPLRVSESSGDSSNLVAFGPEIPLETAHALPASHDGSEDGTGRGIPLIASAVTAKWAKGSGGPSGDECQNLVTWPKRIAPALTARFFNDQGIDNQHVNGGCGLFVPDEPAGALAFDCKNDPESDSISPPLRAMNCHGRHVCGGGHVAVAAPILEPNSRTGVTTEDPRCGDGIGSSGDPMFTLQATRPHGVMVHWAKGGGEVENKTAGTLRSEAEHNYQFLRQENGVRRLTPRECERLQGFLDDFTLVDWPKARRSSRSGRRAASARSTNRSRRAWPRGGPSFRWITCAANSTRTTSKPS